MKAIIYTFSGTGNTFLTSDFIADELRKLDYEVMQCKIEESVHDNLFPELKNTDHVIIGYPIHAFNAPKIVVEFVKKLPSGNGKKVSIFKTSGEPFSINNSSSHLLIKQLSLKGYKYMVETHFLMPYNIMFRYPVSLVKQMYILMQDMSKQFALNIAGNTQNIIRYTMFNRIVSYIFRIQWGGARFNGRFYSCRHDKCIMCKKCVNDCPSNNIRVANGKIRFDGKCLMCMRCVQNCPVDAINIGILRFWAVRGKYNFKKIASDDSIPSEFINKKTTGYFRLFKSFFNNHNK